MLDWGQGTFETERHECCARWFSERDPQKASQVSIGQTDKVLSVARQINIHRMEVALAVTNRIVKSDHRSSVGYDENRDGKGESGEA